MRSGMERDIFLTNLYGLDVSEGLKQTDQGLIV